MLHSRLGLLAAAVVLAGTGTAFGQAPVPNEQVTADPLVPAAEASQYAVLTGADEVSPVTSEGTGTAWIGFDPDTNTLSWTVEFSGLSGAATGAHFHGPAAAGENAGVVMSLVEADAEITSPIQGTATLTAEQAAQLAAGEWYINIHTAANPAGEIRGQVLAADATAAESAAAAGGGDMDALMTAGQQVYVDNCQGCHGNRGQGGNGVTLAGFGGLADARTIIAQIVFGGTFMPQFPNLTRSDIAAVATFIRNSFGNSFGIVTEEDVAPLR